MNNTTDNVLGWAFPLNVREPEFEGDWWDCMIEDGNEVFLCKVFGNNFDQTKARAEFIAKANMRRNDFGCTDASKIQSGLR